MTHGLLSVQPQPEHEVDLAAVWSWSFSSDRQGVCLEVYTDCYTKKNYLDWDVMGLGKDIRA